MTMGHSRMTISTVDTFLGIEIPDGQKEVTYTKIRAIFVKRASCLIEPP